MKIAAIAEPTGTFLDMMHIANKVTFDSILSIAEIRTAVADGKDLKMFYVINNDNVPEKFLGKISLADMSPRVIDGKKYLPVYIGSKEAKMMIEEKLFSKAGDKIEGLFGNNIIIVGILPETKTALDMMHFVGDDFQIKK
jgi:hypothetical protein